MNLFFALVRFFEENRPMVFLVIVFCGVLWIHHKIPKIKEATQPTSSHSNENDWEESYKNDQFRGGGFWMGTIFLGGLYIIIKFYEMSRVSVFGLSITDYLFYLQIAVVTTFTASLYYYYLAWNIKKKHLTPKR